jgi:hypothetical protein
MNRFVSLLIVVLFAAVPLAAAAPASAPFEPKFRPGAGPGAIANDYIVVLQDDVPREQVETMVRDLARRYELTPKEVWTRALKGFWVSMPEFTARMLSNDPRVRYIEQNARMFKTSGKQITDDRAPYDRNGVMADPSLNYPAVLGDHPLWHLWRLNHRNREDQDRTYTYAPDSDGAGVRIYVVDTGVLRFHREFVDDAGAPTSEADKRDPLQHQHVKELPGSNVTDTRVWASSAPHKDCAIPALTLHVDGSSALVNYPASIWDTNFKNQAHGTAVGSAAAGRNVGVAKKADLVPVKTDECGTDSNTAYFIRAFDWIVTEAGKGTRVPGVVTMSTYRTLARCETWEGTRCKTDESDAKLYDSQGYTNAFEEAVQAVVGEGIPVVASANNNGRDACHDMPARFSRNGGRGGVITVGGLSKAGDYRFVKPNVAGAAPSDSSNWGPCVDLWAPAEEIALASVAGWSRYFDDDFTGTSYSAPMVAGLIARMFSEEKSLRDDLKFASTRAGLVEKIWTRLHDGATPLPIEAITADAAADESHRDTALKALIETNPTTGAAVYATSRRMAYMGAFGFAEQPAPVVLRDTNQTLRVIPAITGTQRKTEWYASGSTTPVKTFLPADGDHSLCIRVGAPNGCLSPTANTSYWARVTLTATPAAGGSSQVVSADSAAATVVVNVPVITVQPKNVWVREGTDAMFEVTALAPNGTAASYQWYRGRPGSSSETIIGGATSRQYTILHPSGGTAAGYFVKVTANGQTTASEVAFLRVDAGCPELSVPGAATITPAGGLTPPPGKKVVITLPDPGTSYEYRWFLAPKGPNAAPLKLGRDDVFYPTFGRSISIDPGAATKIFARVSAGKDCPSVDSDVIDVTPACAMTLDISPSTGDLPVGGSRVLSVGPHDGLGPYTYQWFRQRSDGSEAIDPLPGFVTREIDVTTAGTYFVRVNDGTCSRMSLAMGVRSVAATTTCSPRIDLAGPLVLNLFPNEEIRVPFTEPLGVHSSSQYEWLLDGSDLNPSTPVVCTPDIAPCVAAKRIATTPEKLRLRVLGQCFIGLSAESSEDSPLITVHVCQPADFIITPVPQRPTADEAFKLYAPVVTGGTYVWKVGGAVIPNESGPVLDRPNGINQDTTYTVTVSDPFCNSAGVTSAPLTLHPCGTPRRRAVRKTDVLQPSQQDAVIVPAGTVVPLSVDDDHDGVSFEWFRSATASYTDAPVAAGNTATVNITAEKGTAWYWVRLTRTCNNAPLTTNTDFFPVTGTCDAAIVIPPAPASASMPGEHDPPAHVTASVVASGTGLSYAWFEVGNPDSIGSGASYTFSYTYDPNHAPAEVHQNVYVVISGACGEGDRSEPVLLSIRQNTQKIFAFGGGGEKYPIGSNPLTVNMDPREGPGHVYHYVWYRDNGTAAGEALLPDSDELGVPSSRNTYWVRVTGTHTAADGSTYTEVSVSGRIHVWPRGTCELPPVTIAQSVTSTTDSNTPVVFDAMCDWDQVSFQWYEGQSGDTRTPRNSDFLKNERLTVVADTPAAFWVRASLECGAYQDSETVTFTRGGCAPLLINQNVPSVDVAYGQDTALYLDPVPGATYNWYPGESSVPLSQEFQPTLERPHVQASGRYRARVTLQKPGCAQTVAESFVATVRVASCPSITPPAWQTEVWTTLGVSATLDATAPQGASGYQWYRGEVGDTSNLLTGQTLATFQTPPLTGDTKYWVRITGSSCIVDSPTITVRVCVPPALSGGQTLDRIIERNQVVTWAITAAGTDLTYQWYQGVAGDVSHPVGPNLDRYRVTPDVTTQYWVKVTGRCGTLNSGTYKATVCPAPQAPTTSASLVMPGATPTVSISSTGTDLTYQWYIGSWDDISHPIAGATTATITPTVNATTSYWCKVTSGSCSRNSAPVTVNVCPARQLTWNYNAQTKVAKNDTQIISVSITGDEPVSQLTFYIGDIVGDVAHATPINLVTNAYQIHPTATTSYWARAISANGCYTDSSLLKIEVCIPTITTHPQPVMLDKTNPAATTTLTVAADITPVTYQWYIGASGDMTSPVSGATSATLTVSPSAATTYWARVDGSCGIWRASDAATVTVCTPPTVNVSYAPGQIQSGTPTSMSVSATGAELTYQWYRGARGVTTNPVPAGTAYLVQVTPATTTTYWCRVTSRGTCWADSNAITVDVCNPPAITVQPQPPPRSFTGTQVTLSVTATPSTGLTYQWYTGATGDVAAPVAGATASSLTVAPAAETSYWVRVKNGICATDSTAALVSLCAYTPTVTLPATRNIASGETTTLPFPTIYPLNEPKHIVWYRGQSGDRSVPVLYTMSAPTLAYTTPALTANTPYWMDFEHGGCVTMSTATTVTVCKPAINASPVGTTISSGSSTILTVSTTPIAGQTYQWYTGTPGTITSPVAGATSASVTVSPTSTTSYWVRVKGTCVPDATVDSAEATVIVCAPPAITSISPTRFIRAGNTTSLTVLATGSNLTYQWYIGATGVTGNPVAGGTSNVLSVSPATTTSYWCRVSADGLCTVNSQAMLVDVCTNPTITSQPAPQRIFTGATATLTVVASSPFAMTYQWYTGAAGDTSSPIGGGTSPSVTVSPTVDTSYWVRVRVGTQCSVDSTAALVSMCAYSPTATLPATRNIASGESVTLTFPTMYPLDGAKDITWYRGPAGNRSTPVRTASATSVNYTTPATTVTTAYWFEFVHDGCVTVSNVTMVTVCKPTITAQPQSATILSGTSRTLSVTTTGSPLAYQWYIGATGDVSQPVAGATAASLTVTPSATTTYWVRATGCSTTADSDAATVTVCMAPAITSVTKTTTYAINSTGSITANATGTDLTYQWYKGQTGVTTAPVAGGTLATYTFTLKTSEYYWVRVTSGCNGATADSTAVLYSVSPKITVHPADMTISRGTTATLSITATGTYLSYQWMKGDSTVIAGATSSTYTTPVLTTGVSEYWCQVSSGIVGINSVHAFISLCDGPTVTSAIASTNSGTTYTLSVNVYQMHRPQVKYHWYVGPAGNPGASADLGEAGSARTFFGVTTPATYWVRVWWTDDTCYTDTAGKTIP